MARDEVIRVRVTAEEKEEMREHIEDELHYSGFSDYFRTGLYSDKNDNTDDVQIDVEEIAEAVSDELEPLRQEVKEMNEKLDEMSDVLMSDDDEIIDLAVEVYEKLPAGHQLEELDSIDEVRIERSMLADSSSLEKYRVLSDIESWAKWFDVSVTRMTRALNYVKEEYPDVRVNTYKSHSNGVRETVKRYYRDRKRVKEVE